MTRSTEPTDNGSRRVVHPAKTTVERRAIDLVLTTCSYGLVLAVTAMLVYRILELFWKPGGVPQPIQITLPVSVGLLSLAKRRHVIELVRLLFAALENEKNHLATSPTEANAT